MNRTEIFNYLFESFNEKGVEYVIIHSYQNLPGQFDSDIDTAIKTPKINDAIILLDRTLEGTGWRVIQYWRHENYAADCIISNDKEFLQVDFCIHYERNGRVVLSVEELIENRRVYKNFYIPSDQTEFTYILLKKVMKQNFSDRSKEHLTTLWRQMSNEKKEETKNGLKRFFSENWINKLIFCVETNTYDDIKMISVHKALKKKTFNIKDSLRFEIFDINRKIERILYPTGLFIVLLGVDGAGKTTISKILKRKYATAFRQIRHYHSRVRVLNDISQIKSGSVSMDVSDPHGKKYKAGKFVSKIKFAYYFLDFLIGNIVISISKIKSTLILIERYYYDYRIDKIRYNLDLSDKFIGFFEHFVKKPDAIFILTGNSQTLLERKHEITLHEIDTQKKHLEKAFENDLRAKFIDTTINTENESVDIIIGICNQIMRERIKWE